MNEPLINPLWFYLIGVSGKTVVVLGIVEVILGIFLMIHYATINSDCTSEDYEKHLKALKRLAIPFIVGIVMFVAIPLPATIYKMLIASQITPHNINVTGEKLDKLINKAVDKIIMIQEGRK